MKNTYFGCEIASDLFPEQMLEEAKKLSNYPILKVPVRQKGITKGHANDCYFNANILSQSFGGKPVYGWAIDAVDYQDGETGWRFNGHGNWLTPEGNLVDVTDYGRDKFRYFLASDIQLDMSDESLETIRHFVWSDSVYPYVRLLFSQSYGFNQEYYKYVQNWSEEKIDHWMGRNPDDLHRLEYHMQPYLPFLKEKAETSILRTKELERSLEKYVGQLCEVDAFPFAVFQYLEDQICPSEKDRKTFGKIFNYFVEVVNESTPKTYQIQNKTDFANFIVNTIHDFHKTGRSAFEQYRNYKIDSFCWKRKHAYSIWNDVKMREPTICGISSATGKDIWDIPIHPTILAKHNLPKDKHERKIICSRAKRYNVSPKEFLLLTNQKYFPHPYLVKKLRTSDSFKTEFLDKKDEDFFKPKKLKVNSKRGGGF